MLLNGAALNGVALNGGTLVVIEGAASFDTPSAELTASPNQIWAATANAVGNAEAVASATRGVLPEVVLTGSGELYANPHVEAAGEAAVGGSAEFVAYVITLVEAQAGFSCSALFDAVAQGDFGAANISGEASLSADASRIKDGGTATASGTCGFTAAGDVDRRAFATAVLGEAEFTASYRVTSGGVTTHYPGAVLGGTGELELDPDYIFFNSASIFNCGVDVAPSATQEQFAGAQFGTTASINAVLGILAFGEASLAGTANISATAVRTVQPDVAVGASAEISASAVQQHSVSSSIAATGEFAADSVVNVSAAGQFSGSAEATATALREALSYAAFDCPGEFSAIGINVEKIQAEAAVAANADVYAFSTVLRQGTAAVAGTGELLADARTNVEADDPPERTMYRPYTERSMRRPFVDRIMREAA